MSAPTIGYEGNVVVLGQETPFYVTNEVSSDGAEVRELHVVQPPLLPSRLLALMRQVAPMKIQDDDAQVVADIKMDIAEVMEVDSGSRTSPDPKMTRIHRSAFGENWQVINRQAQAIFDALPYRYTRIYPRLVYGAPTLEAAIASIDNKQVKGQYYRQLQADALPVGPFSVDDEGTVIAPGTPFVRFPKEDGEPTFIKAAALDTEEDGSLAQVTCGLTADGLGKAVKNKFGGRIPIWETHYVPKQGIVPVVRWRKGDGGDLQLLHTEVERGPVGFEGATWDATNSSVIGALLLASLAPEAMSDWRKKEGFTRSSKRTQYMGPLQAVLLSVISGDRLLKGNFVQHIESHF